MSDETLRALTEFLQEVEIPFYSVDDCPPSMSWNTPRFSLWCYLNMEVADHYNCLCLAELYLRSNNPADQLDNGLLLILCPDLEEDGDVLQEWTPLVLTEQRANGSQTWGAIHLLIDYGSYFFSAVRIDEDCPFDAGIASQNSICLN